MPVLSFLLLRGRCRSCGQPISPRYPLVEASLALLFVASVLRFPPVFNAAEAAVFCFLLLGLFCMDAETLRLPDSFTLPGTVLGLLQTAVPGHGLAQALDFARLAPFPVFRLAPTAASLLAAGGGAALLLGIRQLYRRLRGREGMGLGDVKLAAMLGAWLGIAGLLLALALGIFSAAGAGILLLAKHRGSAGKHALPFGSFLCFGAALTVFLGRPMLMWYFHFFH